MKQKHQIVFGSLVTGNPLVGRYYCTRAYLKNSYYVSVLMKQQKKTLDEVIKELQERFNLSSY